MNKWIFLYSGLFLYALTLGVLSVFVEVHSLSASKKFDLLIPLVVLLVGLSHWGVENE